MEKKNDSSILIVDDMPENLTLLARILASRGYQVKTARDGREALECVRTALPDLILMDINMPGLDGFQVSAQLKADDRTREIPIIFISAMDKVEDKVNAFHAGGVDYILKPFDLEEVLARVELHLALRSLRVQLEAANQKLAERVAELARSQERLKQRERKLEAFVDALPNLSFVFDEMGCFREIVANEEKLLTAKAEVLLGHTVQETMPPQVAIAIMSALQTVIETEETQIFEYEAPILTGGVRWFEGRMALIEKDEQGHASVVLVASDITDRVSLYQEVQKLANLDSLTGCNNRRHFMALADQEFQRSLRYHRSLSLAIMDIDHFKNINDQYGHQTGDQVLRSLVELCQSSLRGMDILGRYGGEEFIVLMPETGSQAELAADRIREKIEKMRVRTSFGDISITVSIGIGMISENIAEIRTLDLLIAKADRALYAAKAAGRNCVRMA